MRYRLLSIDVLLYLLERFPGYLSNSKSNAAALLSELAETPLNFLSGCRFGFWQRCIYSSKQFISFVRITSRNLIYKQVIFFFLKLRKYFFIILLFFFKVRKYFFIIYCCRLVYFCTYFSNEFLLRYYIFSYSCNWEEL